MRFLFGIFFGILAIGLLATTLTPARAETWCGFIDKDHSRVRCGFSSLDQCKQMIGDNKDGYCIPDPSFASRERRHVAAADMASFRVSETRR